MGEQVDTALGASYRLVRPVGSGASGEVWLATDIRTDENVAAYATGSDHNRTRTPLRKRA